ADVVAVCGREEISNALDEGASVGWATGFRECAGPKGCGEPDELMRACALGLVARQLDEGGMIIGPPNKLRLDIRGVQTREKTSGIVGDHLFGHELRAAGCFNDGRYPAVPAAWLMSLRIRRDAGGPRVSTKNLASLDSRLHFRRSRVRPRPTN